MISSKNLDAGINKIYKNGKILSSIIVSKETYYLIFSDRYMLEVEHNELKDDDIFKIILLIEEANEVLHQISSEDLEKILNNYKGNIANQVKRN